MLWPARSQSRLATLYIESSDSFVASAAVSIVTGWSEPVPGRELHPLKSSAFHGALFCQLVGSETTISVLAYLNRNMPKTNATQKHPISLMTTGRGG